MDPFTAIAIGAGANFVGGLLQNEQNVNQANRANQFSNRMSSTAHQREVKDLRAAGLNPILSANSGASTPTGAQAKMENVLSGGVNSAMDAIRLKNETALMGSQVNLNQASATAAQASALTSATTAKQNEVNTRIMQTNLPAISAEAKTRTGQANWDRKMQDLDNIQRRIQNGLETGGSALRMLQKPGIPIGKPPFKKGDMHIDKHGAIQRQY